MNTADPKAHEDYVVIGKIGKPYALKGWMKLHSFTQPESNIMTYSPLYIEQRGQWVLLKDAHVREEHQGYLIHLKDCETPEEARHYTHAHIGVTRAQLPTPETGEYYWHDLIGLAVINQQNQVLGHIESLMDVGEHDVLVVHGDRERLIPFLDGQVVVKIDMKARSIHVNWDADF